MEWKRITRDAELKLKGLAPEPSLEVAEELYDLVEAYNEWKGLDLPPQAGGTEDQPLWWTEGMKCLVAAKAKADRDIEEAKTNPGKNNPFGRPEM